MAQAPTGKTLDPLSFSALLYRTCVVGCGLGSAATVYLMIGLLGYLNHPWSGFFVVIILLMAAGYFFAVFFSVPDKTLIGRMSWFASLAFLVVDLILGLVPPTTRDELTHHLAIPRLYADQGRIFEVPFALPSYYPMLLDMLYIPFVQWEWDFIAKLVHGLFGFLTALLVYAYLSFRLNAVYGLLGFLFFISVPVIQKLSSQAYVDLGLTFFSTAALLCLLQWKDARSQRWLLLGGLLAGFALATKPNALLVFFLASLIFLYSLGDKAFTRRSWLSYGLLCLCAFLTFSPWLIRNFLWTGNPFFPFFASTFGGADRVAGDSGLGPLELRRLLYGESWWEIAALPLRVFFFGRDDEPRHFDGVLNPMLILFLPWAFKGKWIEEKRFFFLFTLWYFFYASFLTHLRVRYLLPIVPPLVILMVCGVHNIYLRIRRPWVLGAALASLFLLNLLYLAAHFEKLSPLAYLLGKESREAYLTRFLSEYPVFQYINQNLSTSARVYLLFVGRRAYYCRRDYFYDGGELPWVLLQSIQKSHDPKSIEMELRRRGLTHLMIREDLLHKFLRDNLPVEKQKLWQSFSQHTLKGLVHARGYSLYQING